MKYLPERAQIESFGGGGFRFAGMSHQGSLLVLPSGMRAWRPVALDELEDEDFSGVLAEKKNIDVLLLGTGVKMQRPTLATTTFLHAAGLRFDAMSTSAAIHTYNIMLGEGRRVAAALLAVDKAHG